MTAADLSDTEFARFQSFIFDVAGITLSASKKALVSGRLGKRLAFHGLPSFSLYLKMLTGGAAPDEVQMAVDLLTTNETYFFRENKHFELLREWAGAAKEKRQPMRVWSAASSSGEEAYSMAMVLDDVLGAADWEVFGSDLSSRVLQRAKAGHYSEERTDQIPLHYRKRYCLRGIGTQAGTLLIERQLLQRVRFAQVNLNRTLPNIGQFDVIFLRNVMIYFSIDTKRKVVERVLGALKPGGYLCIGHSESLNEITDAVQQFAPAVYRKA